MEKQFLDAYERYADDIFRYCYFRVSDRDLALDLKQEVFTRAWNYTAQGKKVDNMRAFLYRVARNLIVDEYRRKKPVSLDAVQESGVQFAGQSAEHTGKILDAKYVLLKISELEEPYREVITLRCVQECSVKEIAEILEERENTVSVRIHRGLRVLRALLEKEEHGKKS